MTKKPKVAGLVPGIMGAARSTWPPSTTPLGRPGVGRSAHLARGNPATEGPTRGNGRGSGYGTSYPLG